MHILVVTNETAVGHTLYDTVVAAAREQDAEVTVVAPALNSPLRHWCSDVDKARRSAERRLKQCLDALHCAGVRATGLVGDSDPMHAIEDEIARRPADQLIIATHPPHRSGWLELSLVERARAAFARPVTHIIVDLDQQIEQLCSAA